MIKNGEHVPPRQIRELWQTAFGDEEDYIDFFLSRRYNPKQALVEVRDGRAVSMLFLLDVTLCCEGEPFRGFYLYAACTLPEYRKRGIMESLLSAAHQFAIKEGADFIALRPANSQLFTYYQKNGYKTFFTRKQALVKGRGACLLSPLTCEELEVLQSTESGVHSRTIWPTDALDYALEEHALYGEAWLAQGDSRRLGCFLQRENGRLIITELWGDECLLPALIASLGETEAEVSAPPWVSFSYEEAALVPHGMLLWCAGDKKSPPPNRNACLSLTLG